MMNNSDIRSYTGNDNELKKALSPYFYYKNIVIFLVDSAKLIKDLG